MRSLYLCEMTRWWRHVVLWVYFHIGSCNCLSLNTLRPRQNGRLFADDTFKCIFLNQNVWISIKISLNFVPRDPINNIPALVQIMAWRRPGDKPLSEPMMVCLLTHICVTRPQWVNGTKLLPEPMLTYHQHDSVAFTWRQFHRKCTRIQSVNGVWILNISNHSRISHGTIS